MNVIVRQDDRERIRTCLSNPFFVDLSEKLALVELVRVIKVLVELRPTDVEQLNHYSRVRILLAFIDQIFYPAPRSF